MYATRGFGLHHVPGRIGRDASLRARYRSALVSLSKRCPTSSPSTTLLTAPLHCPSIFSVYYVASIPPLFLLPASAPCAIPAGLLSPVQATDDLCSIKTIF